MNNTPVTTPTKDPLHQVIEDSIKEQWGATVAVHYCDMDTGKVCLNLLDKRLKFNVSITNQCIEIDDCIFQITSVSATRLWMQKIDLDQNQAQDLVQKPDTTNEGA